MNPSLPRRGHIARAKQAPDAGRRRSLQRLSVSAALVTPWTAMPSRAADAVPPTQAAVGALLTERLRYQGVGYLSVQVDGKDINSTVAGRRQAGSTEPLTTDALFEIGSITKTFTALLLADAMLRKPLALDGPIETALPNGLRLRDSADAPIRWIDLCHAPLRPATLAGQHGARQPGRPVCRLCEAQLLDWVRSHKAERQRDVQMGLAWMRVTLKGRTLINHDGGTYGFSSSLWLDPERQRASIVLANAMVEVQDIALHLLDPSLMPVKDMSLTAQTAMAVSAEQLAPLAGTYALNPQFKLVVVPRDGRLFARAIGQGEFELYASGPRRHFARVTPLTVEFSTEPLPTRLTLKQNGRTLRFQREP